MSEAHTPIPPVEQEGHLDGDGELYLPSLDESGPSAGGGLGDGTTSGTTGRILPPGIGEPVDDEEL